MSQFFLKISEVFSNWNSSTVQAKENCVTNFWFEVLQNSNCNTVQAKENQMWELGLARHNQWCLLCNSIPPRHHHSTHLWYILHCYPAWYVFLQPSHSNLWTFLSWFTNWWCNNPALLEDENSQLWYFCVLNQQKIMSQKSNVASGSLKDLQADVKSLRLLADFVLPLIDNLFY